MPCKNLAHVPVVIVVHVVGAAARAVDLDRAPPDSLHASHQPLGAEVDLHPVVRPGGHRPRYVADQQTLVELKVLCILCPIVMTLH